MTTVTTIYQGSLRCQATHLQSGTGLITDAPSDNNGKGESFSPTDLVATALGTCIMTIMGIYAQKNNISLEGLKMDITKTMTDNPRRIGKIDIVLTMPKTELNAFQKTELETITRSCPVCLSLHPDIEKTFSFVW